MVLGAGEMGDFKDDSEFYTNQTIHEHLPLLFASRTRGKELISNYFRVNIFIETLPI